MKIDQIFESQFKNKLKFGLTSAKERIAKLDIIHVWILNNKEKIQQALYNDFKKAPEETNLTEIFPVVSEIKLIKRKLRKWTQKKRVNRTLVHITNSAYIKYKAKGNVLIISPWNYPFLLSVGPLISAVAAGNTVILKPSEITYNTGSLLKEMFEELFLPEEIAVILGDKNTASELLELSFDHIFFTGSTEVGKIVAQSAVKNLTSFTLELGGKSPAIVDDTANLKMAAEKIIWGKFLNKGQTCIAPDYILVDKSIRRAFVKHLITQIKKFYGNNNDEITKSKSYARIINGDHFERLSLISENAILNKSKILSGGKFDNENYFIEPTIILTNCFNCQISEEEIFGPLLPIVEYETLKDAIAFINKRTPPLAIYIFSKNKSNIDKVTTSTQSGGVGINEVVLQFTHLNLPFGGVRQSGIGKSHGYAGFKEFSNERAYIKGGIVNPLKLLYPPYTETKSKLINFLIKYL